MTLVPIKNLAGVALPSRYPARRDRVRVSGPCQVVAGIKNGRVYWVDEQADFCKDVPAVTSFPVPRYLTSLEETP